MKLILDCYPCMIRQVLSTVKLIGLDEKQTKYIVDYTLHHLLEASADTTPQHIIVSVTDHLKTTYPSIPEILDPYKVLKQYSNATVLDTFDVLESMIKAAPEPLEAAVKNAAAGNIIDFGAKDHGSIDINKEISAIPHLQFAHYDYRHLKERLEHTRLLLYIGDNAGEIVFDRLFIRQIKKDFPDCAIYFATRSEPVINDVTGDDAFFVGIDKETTVISSGCRYPGLMLDAANDELRDVWKKADCIISKGQGNYEGLSGENDCRLFFILRIKCDRVAKEIHAGIGDLVLLNSCQFS